ncbi:MAG: signal peptidase I [Clostridia bacterium]|nr:signal peptidase I [Clostridia bacterium]
MNSLELIAAAATALGVTTFAAIFTILYRGYSKSSIRELQAGKRDIELMDEYVYESMPSVKRRRRVFGVIKTVLFYGVLILLIPVFVFSVLNKLQGNVMMLGDRAVMVVASNSMSEKNEANKDYLKGRDDQFDTNSIIFLERVTDAEELKLYDVIAFEDPTSGKKIIHRIIGINADGSFETRGDRNNASDEFHPTVQNVIGRYTGTHIPVLGSLILFFQSVGGIVTLIALFYCLMMLDRYNAKIKKTEEQRLQYLCEAIELDLSPSEHSLRAEFKETLYYKGYAYYFNEKGFIGKDEITDASYLEKSDSTAIRVVDADGTRTETEVHINSEEGDETP